MANSREGLAKFLTGVFASKAITKSKLSDDTGIGRSMIDGYLKQENAASIDQLDRLAEALGKAPWDLLKPAETPSPLAVVPADSLRDLLRILTTLNESGLEALLRLAKRLAVPAGDGKKVPDRVEDG